MSLMSLKIDEIYETEIIGLENEGAGVAKINGIIVFVPKALVGEKLRVRIIEIKKNFARGKIVEILEKSSNRITPSCPYYQECGGCNLRHQTKEENLKFKKEKVETALKKIGKIDVMVDDIVPSFKENNYRNKVSFKVENDRIGFYGEGTYQLINVENCMLAENEINNALTVVRSYIKNYENEIKTITIKYGNAAKDILIDIFSTNTRDINILEYLDKNINNLKTVIFNGNVVFGNGYIKQISNGLMFNCSSKSFFQVNSNQAEKLYETAISLAELSKEDIVLDLYCGTGTITSIIAGYVKKVIGIEIVNDAIIDAKCNLEINGIQNVKFICGDATKEISKIKEKIDVIFVDPPRKGINRDAIAIMKKLSPKKIIYISCNPVTMARDLSYLSNMYDVKKVIPFDMFPNTSHVECVCVLKIK